jgi:hypothetical protein
VAARGTGSARRRRRGQLEVKEHAKASCRDKGALLRLGEAVGCNARAVRVQEGRNGRRGGA